jgi:tRNA-Thr(GGU) m(6)t(6)A37 methyltransferase TsaA
MGFVVEPIGFVHSARVTAEDDYWGLVDSRIELIPSLDADALLGLDAFSHIEVLFLFHLVDPSKVVTGRRHPRNNAAWPEVGILAQRGKNRPNRIGSTICKMKEVSGTTVVVTELDAIDGTPVLDLKPVMQEFLPRGVVRQPAWSRELMQQYWASATKPGETE